MSPQTHSESKVHWIVFHRDKVLIEHDKSALPTGVAPHQRMDLEYEHELVLPLPNGEQAYVIDLGYQAIDDGVYNPISLRQALLSMEHQWFETLARAWQSVLFLRTHRYCGQCGGQMQRVDWELATQCYQCKHRCYPRISPCIIVAIRKGDKILLAQGQHHKDGMHSVLAGFVESGETLEQAVHREVFEEVGIQVTNLRYFDSQPWPFPHSLMVGFLADWESGEIQVDGKEILHADWFLPSALPTTPPSFSIAGRLISHTLNQVNNPD